MKEPHEPYTRYPPRASMNSVSLAIGILIGLILGYIIDWVL